MRCSARFPACVSVRVCACVRVRICLRVFAHARLCACVPVCARALLRTLLGVRVTTLSSGYQSNSPYVHRPDCAIAVGAGRGGAPRPIQQVRQSNQWGSPTRGSIQHSTALIWPRCRKNDVNAESPILPLARLELVRLADGSPIGIKPDSPIGFPIQQTH